MASPLAWVVGNDPNLHPKRSIGSGGFGDVYEVQNIATGEVFARKVLRLGLLKPEEIENEIRAVEKLCRPGKTNTNIVHVLRHEHLVNSPCYYFDMELCDFNLETFAERLWKRSDWEEMLSTRSDALDFRSRMRAIWLWRSPPGHKTREQYSSNLNNVNVVLYSRQDELWKIGDFGISTTGSSQAQTTRRGRGTSGYRSPELIGSQKQTFTNKVDIWGLGCILYRLAYDAKLFQDDFAVREWAIVSAPLPFSIDGPMSGNSAENRADVSSIQNLISSMLLRQPEGRPSATELLSNFTAAAKSSDCLPFPNQEDTNVLDGTREEAGIIGANGRALLIWIGDEPLNDVEDIQYALSIGIAVKIIYSPTEAMNWVGQNTDFLQPNSRGDKIRIITDLRRWQKNKWNGQAGTDFVHHFRDFIMFNEIPILVYTSNISHTDFVNDFPFTAATTRWAVTRQYIDGLAKGEIWNPRLRRDNLITS